jgi:hypothetical protein
VVNEQSSIVSSGNVEGGIEMLAETVLEKDGKCRTDLGFKNKNATGGEAVMHALEEALDAVVAPIEVDPLGRTQAHDDRVCGVGFGSFYKIFAPEPAIVGEGKRVHLVAAARAVSSGCGGAAAGFLR